MNAWDFYQLQEKRAQAIGVDKLRACLPAGLDRGMPDLTAWRLAHYHGPVSLLATMAQAGTGPEGHGWERHDTVDLLRHVIRYHVDQMPPPEPEGQDRESYTDTQDRENYTSPPPATPEEAAELAAAIEECNDALPPPEPERWQPGGFRPTPKGNYIAPILDASGATIGAMWGATPEEAVKRSRLAAAAPALLAALKDLLGDKPDVQGRDCIHCGREYDDEPEGINCPADDCPGHIARAAMAEAGGA